MAGTIPTKEIDVNHHLATAIAISSLCFGCGDSDPGTDASPSDASADARPGDSSPGDSSPGDTGMVGLPDPVTETLFDANCCANAVDIVILASGAPVIMGEPLSATDTAAFDRSSGSFVEETVSAISPWHIAAVVGSDDSIHVLFLSGTGDFEYAVRAGGAWTVTTAGTDPVFGRAHFDLALDTSNTPHIVYENSATRSLIYGIWNGSGFDVETVEGPTAGTDQFGDFASIAVGDDGTVHIASSATVSGVRGLRYAVGTAGSFTSSDVPGLGEGIFGTILLDSSGNPHIVSSLDAGARPGGIYWSGHDGSAWTETAIDTDVRTMEMDAAFDAMDRLHVATATYVAGFGTWRYDRTDGTETVSAQPPAGGLDRQGSIGIAVDASNVAHLVISRVYVHF